MFLKTILIKCQDKCRFNLTKCIIFKYNYSPDKCSSGRISVLLLVVKLQNDKIITFVADYINSDGCHI